MVMTITIMAISMIIYRNEFDKVKKASSRLLIYGRRKVFIAFKNDDGCITQLDHTIKSIQLGPDHVVTVHSLVL